VSFQSPALLAALAAVPAVLGAYGLARRRTRRYAVRFTGVPTLSALVDPVPRWRRHLPAGLFALALAALALALARPEATVAVPRERASVLLVTDVSGSMQATDVEPSRLEAVKAAAVDFLDEVPEQIQVGAVAFSEYPHTLERPSEDRSRVEELVEGLSAEGGTATGEALSEGLDLLGPREGRERPPAAMVLLSDGETTTGRDPLEAAREARHARVPIYTVALGTPAGVIETPTGRPLAVPPDPQTMREIARVSGGSSYTAEDADRLSALYERLGSQIATRDEQREITAVFAAGGLLLLLAAAGSSLRRFGRLP
jgi:Ca-activated chloride channel homolog